MELNKANIEALAVLASLQASAEAWERTFLSGEPVTANEVILEQLLGEPKRVTASILGDPLRIL